jgi:hypothetical protein
LFVFCPHQGCLSSGGFICIYFTISALSPLLVGERNDWFYCSGNSFLLGQFRLAEILACGLLWIVTLTFFFIPIPTAEVQHWLILQWLLK